MIIMEMFTCEDIDRILKAVPTDLPIRDSIGIDRVITICSHIGYCFDCAEKVRGYLAKYPYHEVE